METLSLEIAGSRYRFELSGFACTAALAARYASFLLPGDGVDVCAAPVRLAATREVPAEIGDFRATFSGPLARFGREDIAVAEAGDGSFAGRVEDEPFSFDMLLRGLVNLSCARAGRLLLHAAGFAEGGRAQVHPGLEGAGKSTLARRRLAEGAALLSDEMVVVDPLACAACGTPFMGELPDPRPRGFLPLERIEIVSGWGRDGASPLSPLAALRRLSPLAVNYGPGTELSGRFYAALVALVERFPVGEMTFLAGGPPPPKGDPR